MNEYLRKTPDIQYIRIQMLTKSIKLPMIYIYVHMCVCLCIINRDSKYMCRVKIEIEVFASLFNIKYGNHFHKSLTFKHMTRTVCIQAENEQMRVYLIHDFPFLS